MKTPYKIEAIVSAGADDRSDNWGQIVFYTGRDSTVVLCSSAGKIRALVDWFEEHEVYVDLETCRK